MRLRVCPQCGSKNIFAGKMSSGILYGVSSWMEECRDCGYKGNPVIFDSAEEYISFLKKLQTSKRKNSLPKGISKDNESEEIDQCTDSTIEDDVHWHHGKWWLELVIAGLLGCLVSFSSFYRNISVFGIAVGMVYSFLEFVIFFIFILIGIIVIEYLIYLLVKHFRKKRGC